MGGGRLAETVIARCDDERERNPYYTPFESPSCSVYWNCFNRQIESDLYTFEADYDLCCGYRCGVEHQPKEKTIEIIRTHFETIKGLIKESTLSPNCVGV